MDRESAEPGISLHPLDRLVQVAVGDTLLADTTRAIELRERGYNYGKKAGFHDAIFLNIA